MRNMFKWYAVAISVLVMLLAFTGAAQAATVSTAKWSVVPSANPPGDNSLFAVAAISTNDVWSVGSTGEGNPFGGWNTLAEHWNGSSWSVVASPSPGVGNGTSNTLSGVAAASTSDVWAVGYYLQNSESTLIEHWNGSSWSAIPSPNSGPSVNQLFAVAAVSANSAFAVGSYNNAQGAEQTLIEQWNGTGWSVVASPSPGPAYNALRGVAAVSANNAWAVGNYTDQQGKAQALVEHWNGLKWSVVPAANPGSSGNFLSGITAVSANNLWAVGHYSTGTVTKTLAERWDGSKWTVVASPNPQIGMGYNSFSSVTAISANNLWAVGTSGFASGLGSYISNTPFPVTLIEHWNGAKWSVFSSPNPGAGGNFLDAVSGTRGNSQVWAVGTYNNGARPDLTLTELYS